MHAEANLIEQLDAFAHRDIRQRAEALRRVTDLFVSSAGRFSDDQIALFDDVMTRLIGEIDQSARAAFGRRLAQFADAPPRIMRGLALDDEIEVAGPILSQSERLDEATLVEGARTKSQDHLLAISRRRTLDEPVTTILAERGDRAVVMSTASNVGARFSDAGYSTMVQRARDDGELTLAMWVRREIPRQHLLALFAQASESVRQDLAAVDQARGGILQGVIAEASDRIQAGLRERSEIYSVARANVMALQKIGKLHEPELARFAAEGRFDETTVTLSLLADLPISVMERLVASRRVEQILVVAKAIGLAWETTRSILLLHGGGRERSVDELDLDCDSFARLNRDTARKALQFYRLRERAANGS